MAKNPTVSNPSGFLSQPLRMGEDRGEGSAYTLSTSLDPAEALDDTVDGVLRRRVEHQYPLDLATHFRRNQSPPEGILWSYLRNRQLLNLKFRRQHPLGPYYADFYCAEARLVVEIDGSTHASRRGHDAQRDRWMREQGVEVLRFPASLIPDSIPGVLRRIGEAATKRVRELKKE